MNARPENAGSHAGPDLRQVLRQITERMSAFMGVERSSIFLFDAATDELWTPAAQGIEGSDEIRIKSGQGIAGEVMKTGVAMRIDDPYNDPRFFPEVDRRSGFRTRNLFCRPISNTSGARIGVIQLLNKAGGPLTARDEELLDVLCAQAAIAIENARLYESLKRVNASERALHAELQSKHSELQVAFNEIERAAMQREILARKMKTVRASAVVAIFLLFGVLGFFAWRAASPAGAAARAPRFDPTIVDDPSRWHTVSMRPLTSAITLLGNIEPLEIAHLTSPFRGRVAEKNFEYGELVTEGQLLARVDTTELQVELRNASIAAIRARHELSRLEQWSASPEMARAERALRKAELSYEANKRNLEELEQLSTLGIIAASTLDSARQQFATQEADLRSAQEDLANIRASASEERITIARYEVANTDLRVKELEEKLARAEIHAPFSGIVILPNSRPIPNRNRDNNGFFEVGTTINQGEVLLSLGNMEAVAVRTRADEVDVANIRHGQPVEVTGDAFPGVTLRGEVSYLSSQAILTNNRPYFEVGIKTAPLEESKRNSVRLGMTARLRILVQQAESAVVVPVSAVFSEGGETRVWKRVATDGAIDVRQAGVRCGVTSGDSVEILAGVAPGDTVLINARSWRP